MRLPALRISVSNKEEWSSKIIIGGSGSIAGFGMILRNSDYKGSVTYKWIYDAAKSAKGDDPYDYRSEFIELIQAAKRLDSKKK